MDAPHSKKQNSKSLWSLSQDQPQAFTLLPLLAINIVRLTLLLGPTLSLVFMVAYRTITIVN